MKRISADFRKGYAKVRIENSDDLWYISQIVDKGDFISGKTLRKMSAAGGSCEGEKKSAAIKKPVFIKIMAEKIDFSESQSSLRILGPIEEGPEDIPKGDYHSFNIEEGTEITISKPNWLNFQVSKLEESFEVNKANLLLIAFDREEAYFAVMKKYGYEILTHISGNVQKKAVDDSKKSNFYTEILTQAKQYDERHKFDNIILASPAFWKDEIQKNITDDLLKKKIVYATCSSVTKTSFNEILKREELRTVLSKDRTSKEINLVETLMSEISKDGKSAYGFKETKNAIESGAVEKLLVSDGTIQKLRADDNFGKLDYLMRTADKMNADVHIISSKNEGGKKLDGLGGIGALLRYKLNY